MLDHFAAKAWGVKFTINVMLTQGDGERKIGPMGGEENPSGRGQSGLRSFTCR
jgi:hypothetical protein